MLWIVAEGQTKIAEIKKIEKIPQIKKETQGLLFRSYFYNIVLAREYLYHSL